MGILDGFRGMLADYTPNLLPEDPDKRAAARQGLLAAGAAMMAAKGHNFFGSVGEGLLAGGESYQGALTQQQQDRLRKAQQQRWDLENEQNTAKLAREKEADGIIAGFGAPGSISGAAGVSPTSGGAQSPAGSAPGAPGAGAAPAGGYSTAYNGTPYSGPEGSAAAQALFRAGATELVPEQGNQVMALARQGMTVDQAAQMVLGGGGAPAPQGTAVFGPPPDLPRIGQPRRPPAFDSSLEGAPGAGGTMPSAFTPGQPPRRLPSLEGLPMLDGSQQPLRAANSLAGLPKVGETPSARADYASQAYEENMGRYLALMKKGHIDRAKVYFDAAKKLEPKVKEIREMTTADGKTVVANIYEDGRPPQAIEGYIPGDPKLTYHNTGGETLGLDPRGKVVVRLPNSERPSSRSRGGAGGAGGGSDGTLDGETLDMMADQALRGDRSVFQNIGRGAQGSANLVALRQRITQKAKAQGITGADLASITADYSGQQAGLRTSGTISARIENAAAEAAELAPLAIDAGRNVARAGFLPFGRAQVMFDTKTNDPALNKFATANIGLATAYANAMARGQKATVSDMHEARELLTTAKSQDAYEAIVSQMQEEIKAAQRAPQRVREHLRGEISGRGGDHGAGGGKAKVTEVGDLPKKPPAVGTVEGGHRFKGGNPADRNNWEKVR